MRRVFRDVSRRVAAWRLDHITDHGSIVVRRSDSTLNRHGIRMGSADIYQSVERLPEIIRLW